MASARRRGKRGALRREKRRREAQAGAASDAVGARLPGWGGLLRAALGDADEGGAQDPVADDVARLHDLDDGPGRHLRLRHLEHRLMPVRVEFLALRLEAADAVALKGLEEVALRQFEALDEGLQGA